MSSTYLTLEESKLHTGKSESTLRRLVKSCLTNPSQKKFIKKRKLKNGGYQYLIEKDLLEEKYKSIKSPKPKAKKSSKTVRVEKHSLIAKTKQENSPNETLQVLKQYIQTLEKQLEVKDVQINQKSRQISELLERDRESHLLLDRINEALIKYRVPEYIETQEIEYTEEDIQADNTTIEKKENQKTQSKKKRKKDKATFSDWLNDLDE